MLIRNSCTRDMCKSVYIMHNHAFAYLNFLALLHLILAVLQPESDFNAGSRVYYFLQDRDLILYLIEAILNWIDYRNCQIEADKILGEKKSILVLRELPRTAGVEQRFEVPSTLAGWK